MAALIQKLANELIHLEPPGYIHTVLDTGGALGIAEDEIFLSPMLAEFSPHLDYRRSHLWKRTATESYTAGATEEQIGYWSGEFFKALTTHYNLTPKQAVYFSAHEEANLREHEGGSWDVGAPDEWSPRGSPRTDRRW